MHEMYAKTGKIAIKNNGQEVWWRQE